MASVMGLMPMAHRRKFHSIPPNDVFTKKAAQGA